MDLNEKLIQASKKGLINEVKVLLDAKADINAYDDYSLQWAAANGHLEVINLLLENKADIHAKDDYALRWAIHSSNLNVIKFLIENNANVHANNDESLSRASSFKYKEIVKVLLENNANVDKLDYDFVDEYMKINRDNISYLLELDALNINLSAIPWFDYDRFINIRSEILSCINRLLGKYIGSIVFNYI